MTELRRVRADAAVTLSEIISATGRLPPAWSTGTEATGESCDVDLVKQLSQKAATFFAPADMDSWLAPRLHSAVRIPRRIASDDGVWTWLAVQCQPFVEGRFKKGSKKLHPWRYRGVWSRNALSRLWWGAEMTRNGPDYSCVPYCFARTRTAQFALELMYSWDRGAAIAFTRVAEGLDGRPRLTDSQTKRLSTKIKLLLALRSLDAFGDDDIPDSDEFDAEWAAHTPSFSTLAQSDLTKINGPASGVVGQTKIDELAIWLRHVIDVEIQDDPNVAQLDDCEVAPEF